MPSEWLSLDLGAGELDTMALALENQDHVVLLDDEFARRVAQAAGLTRISRFKKNSRIPVWLQIQSLQPRLIF